MQIKDKDESSGDKFVLTRGKVKRLETFYELLVGRDKVASHFKGIH